MFKTPIRLGKVFGFTVRIDASWLIIFVWVTWSLAAGYFPRRNADWGPGTTWPLALLTSVLFFGSAVGLALLARFLQNDNRFGV